MLQEISTRFPDFLYRVAIAEAVIKKNIAMRLYDKYRLLKNS